MSNEDREIQVTNCLAFWQGQFSFIPLSFPFYIGYFAELAHLDGKRLGFFFILMIDDCIIRISGMNYGPTILHRTPRSDVCFCNLVIG